MANRRYNQAGALAGAGGIGWTTNAIKVAALASGYTFDITHQFVTALGANIVARSSNLSSKTNTAGVLNSAMAVFAAMTGVRVLYLAVFIDTGSDATSSLLYYIDTATNLPFTPNGIDIDVQWDPTTGVFQV